MRHRVFGYSSRHRTRTYPCMSDVMSVADRCCVPISVTVWSYASTATCYTQQTNEPCVNKCCLYFISIIMFVCLYIVIATQPRVMLLNCIFAWHSYATSKMYAIKLVPKPYIQKSLSIMTSNVLVTNKWALPIEYRFRKCLSIRMQLNIH